MVKKISKTLCKYFFLMLFILNWSDLSKKKFQAYIYVEWKYMVQGTLNMANKLKIVHFVNKYKLFYLFLQNILLNGLF